MKRFLLILLLFALPFIILLLPFFIGDPFKSLYYYDTYYDQSEPMFINNNRGFVSTQMFIQNKDKYHFDSFIFGSSRSGFYRVAQWKKYLPEDSHCFHFDGYGESLYLIYNKIVFLNKQDSIKNALICIDQMVLEQVEPFYDHLHFLPPALIDYDNYLSFQFSHIRSYLEPSFLKAYWDYFFTRKVKPYMIESLVFEEKVYDYDISINETGLSKGEWIPYDSAYYTPDKLQSFKNRNNNGLYYKPILKSEQIRMLSEIKRIFDEQKTNYRIVINPVYDQKKFCETDMAILDSIFGNNLYDFSGINTYTQDYRNYNDLSHFKPYIASDVMRIMYEKDSILQKQWVDSIYNPDNFYPNWNDLIEYKRFN